MRFFFKKAFIFSAGLLLLVTAMAKFISASGSAKILITIDPIFAISFRYVLVLVGICELVIVIVCFFGKRLGLQAGLVAWLATSFLAYRFCLVWLGYHKPCSCLGNLTDALSIPPQIADNAMKFILAYLLIGSYASLFWLWKQGRQIPNTAPTSVGGIESHG
jgi:hypothetical protein